MHLLLEGLAIGLQSLLDLRPEALVIAERRPQVKRGRPPADGGVELRVDVEALEEGPYPVIQLLLEPVDLLAVVNEAGGEADEKSRRLQWELGVEVVLNVEVDGEVDLTIQLPFEAQEFGGLSRAAVAGEQLDRAAGGEVIAVAISATRSGPAGPSDWA
ncbi:hypothetical protein BKH31_02950 [Actinomyces oris]|uniref:Uncharacterized protein n=1 Tax=Actinomyces oris TaxID=544580 RepID=A0A1Q8VJC9_9ACTO|nr:hypothetical protein [Actinomyces oris]OLO48202.1 hypothetical protein BKH31_02950 [Actinomyces oris]